METKQTNVAIFGTGELGIDALRRYRFQSNMNIVTFPDNNKEKQGSSIQGIPVQSPEVVSAADLDQIIIASGAHRAISLQLIQLGFNSDNFTVATTRADHTSPEQIASLIRNLFQHQTPLASLVCSASSLNTEPEAYQFTRELEQDGIEKP
ncbi:MAG: CoA binding domain [Idiomarinaceae bacterium HL-53]|nr:MAG: CoA binding domain [Idiomarinaceae bacterium HL-53]CUS49435.1 CoA binding domain-containing protein [Idiomarinaceae bacterium HL-53]